MVYILMCKTKELLEFNTDKHFNIDNIRVINNELLPEILKVDNASLIYYWLESRKIDTSRINAKLLLKGLDLSVYGIQSVIINRNVNMTDSYWLKLKGSHEVYSDFCLRRGTHNPLITDTSLNGIVKDLPKGINCELTNIGSFNKAWLKNGVSEEWLLCKRGDFRNFYAELFTYKLGKALGMNMAKYSYNHRLGVIESVNFTNEAKMLEHYDSLKYLFNDTNSILDEGIVAKNMLKLGKNCFEDYTNMILLDGIVSNIDRHEYNFGVLKSTATGDILGLAPNFDNNLALGSGGHPTTTYLLKEYLSNFGILKHQKKILSKLNYNLISKIDKEVKEELKAHDVSTDYVANHFKQVFSILGIC